MERLPNEQAKAEALLQIQRLKALSHAFYVQAVQLGIHSFIEHTGLMNEHIKVLERAAMAGWDPFFVNVHSGECPVKLKTFEADYLAEKFSCVFAPVFDRESWAVFRAHVENELGIKSEPAAVHAAECLCDMCCANSAGFDPRDAGM